MAILTTKRLVELDGEYGGWLEIDKVKLKRLELEFKAWLLTVDPNNDPHGFLMHDLPIVEAALNGTLVLPFHDQPRLGDWYYREGYKEEPSAFKDVAHPFYNTIRGALYEPPKIIMKDGRYYAWAEFELSEDRTT